MRGCISTVGEPITQLPTSYTMPESIKNLYDSILEKESHHLTPNPVLKLGESASVCENI